MVSANKGFPIVTISRRGDVHFFRPYDGEGGDGAPRLTRLQSKSIPSQGTNLVKDACVTTEGRIVLAYDTGPVQVAHIRLPETATGSSRLITSLADPPHAHVARKARSDVTVACLAPGTSGGFFTGGWDKQLYAWSFTDAKEADDPSDIDFPVSNNKTHSGLTRTHDGLTKSKVTQLAVVPRALAVAGEKLYYGHQQKLGVIDLQHPTAQRTPVNLSNAVQQMHVQPKREFARLLMLETDHLDHQNQLFDTRTGFAGPPLMQFGHRTSKVGHTYVKGDFLHSYFVRGYPDQSVRVWDLRNSAKPVLSTTRTATCEVTHAVFGRPGAGTVLAFGKYDLFYMDARKGE